MPQETYSSSIFNSPNKNLRGLKGLIYNNTNTPYAEEIINDRELAQRKADEAGMLFIYNSITLNELFLQLCVGIMLSA